MTNIFREAFPLALLLVSLWLIQQSALRVLVSSKYWESAGESTRKSPPSRSPVAQANALAAAYMREAYRCSEISSILVSGGRHLMAITWVATAALILSDVLFDTTWRFGLAVSATLCFGVIVGLSLYIIGKRAQVARRKPHPIPFFQVDRQRRALSTLESSHPHWEDLLKDVPVPETPAWWAFGLSRHPLRNTVPKLLLGTVKLLGACGLAVIAWLSWFQSSNAHQIFDIHATLFCLMLSARLSPSSG